MSFSLGALVEGSGLGLVLLGRDFRIGHVFFRLMSSLFELRQQLQDWHEKGKQIMTNTLWVPLFSTMNGKGNKNPYSWNSHHAPLKTSKYDHQACVRNFAVYSSLGTR